MPDLDPKGIDSAAVALTNCAGMKWEGIAEVAVAAYLDAVPMVPESFFRNVLNDAIDTLGRNAPGAAAGFDPDYLLQTEPVAEDKSQRQLYYEEGVNDAIARLNFAGTTCARASAKFLAEQLAVHPLHSSEDSR